MCRITFYVEDGEQQKGPFSLYVDKNWSLTRLKEATHLVFNYPFNTQRWIIADQLAKNNDYTLTKLGAFRTDEPFFLCLVDPKENSEVADVSVKEEKTPTNPNVWVCKKCTNENPLDFVNCTACFEKSTEPDAQREREREQQSPAPKPGQQPPKPSAFNPLEVWECSFCTLVNSNEMANCFACLQVRHDRPASERTKSSAISVVPAEPEIVYDTAKYWKCVQCTLLNVHQMKNCVTCLAGNPKGSRNDYLDLVQLDDKSLIENSEPFECAICFGTIEKRAGVVLRECFHQFCAACLAELVMSNETAVVKCPFIDQNVSCGSVLQEREIKALLAPEQYEKHLRRSLNEAEAKLPNSFHCKTTDCTGWCEFEDRRNQFHCPICKKVNCLNCKAIHEGLNCKAYQEDLKIRALNDVNAKLSLNALNAMLRSREAMECPTCAAIITKISGCDGVVCSGCQTDICWATRGPRWGPKGKGDTSGGCRCNVNGRPCHPQCSNCH